jgi:cell division protein ZipA
MFANLSDTVVMQLYIGAAFVLIIAYIIFSSRRNSHASKRSAAVRTEPLLSEIQAQMQEQAQAATANQPETWQDFHEQTSMAFEPKPEPVKVQNSNLGKRSSDDYEKLVLLYLAAKSGQTISGAELVLATEKVGLVYGYHNVYHRLAEGSGSNEPVFSMANVIQPGYFDLTQIDALQTPGVSFFMTLPGPVSAISAWETMLPIAERMAQLLDAVLLDSDRNALGRQRILHIKEELRTFDREKERQFIKPVR